MSVGLPGAGIGGIFYIASAVAMPFVSITRAFQTHTMPRMRLVLRQALLALGIIAALYATGVLLSHGIVWVQTFSHTAGADTAAGSSSVPHILKIATFALTFGTLALVLLAVQALRFFCARPRADSVTDKPERRAA